MKKLISLILVVLIISATSCTNTKTDIDTSVTTSGQNISSAELLQQYVNAPNEQGIMRVDGVMIRSYVIPLNRGEETIPLAPVFLGTVDDSLGNSANHVITDYAKLKSVFEGGLTGISEGVKAEDVFSENIFEENFVVLTANYTDNKYLCKFAWFDCKFSEETNELNITPVCKKKLNTVPTGSPNVSPMPFSYFVTIPKSFLPEGCDVTALNITLNEKIDLEDSSMPNPLEAGGAVTVAFVLNLEDSYSAHCDEYKDATTHNVDYEKVYADIYNENMEYIKNINLECPNVTVSRTTRFVFINFANRVEFMKYKDYFDGLAKSEYVKDFTIT